MRRIISVAIALAILMSPLLVNCADTIRMTATIPRQYNPRNPCTANEFYGAVEFPETVSGAPSLPNPAVIDLAALGIPNSANEVEIFVTMTQSGNINAGATFDVQYQIYTQEDDGTQYKQYFLRRVFNNGAEWSCNCYTFWLPITHGTIHGRKVYIYYPKDTDIPAYTVASYHDGWAKPPIDRTTTAGGMGWASVIGYR